MTSRRWIAQMLGHIPHTPAVRSRANPPGLVGKGAFLRRLLLASLGVAAVLGGAVAGALATLLPLQVAVLTLSGLVAFFILFSWPEYAILLVLVASSSVFDLKQVPNISIGFTFSAIEILLILLLGLVVAQSLGDRERRYVKTPLDLPLILFFLATFLSLENAVLNLGANIDALEYQWRTMFNYLVFFAVTNLIRTRRQLLRLVTGLFILATIVAVMMLAQQAVGTSVVILPGRVETAGVFEGEFVGVTRILPPGQSLILVMLMPALILLITRQRLGWIGWLLVFSVVLLLAALAFTFNRNMWVGTTVAMGALFLVSTQGQRKNLILFLGALALLVAIAVPITNLYIPHVGRLFEALYIRAASLFTGDRVQYSSSWQWRLMENQHAWQKIQQYPLLGIGPGNDYRPRVRLGGDETTGYMHNTYLFILMDFGLMGFVPFVWFSALFLLRGYRRWATVRDPTLRAIVLGFTLAYVPMLVAGIAAPVFMAWFWTPVVGVMLGINEVIYREHLWPHRPTATA